MPARSDTDRLLSSRTNRRSARQGMSRRAMTGFIRSSLCLFSIVPSGTIATAQDNPNRRIVTVNRAGREFSGKLLTLGGGELSVGGTETQRLATKSLVDLKFKDRPSSVQARDPLVLLADGGWLAARTIASSDEALSVRWERHPAWSPFAIALDGVRGVIFNRPENPADDARLAVRIAEHRERHDLVLLSNGDTLIGEFRGLDEQQLTLQTAAGKSAIERAGVRALAFNSELIDIERLQGEGAIVSLIDGSRFRARNLRTGALDRLGFRTLFGVDLDLPLVAVESVRFLGGCTTYLSDLEPAEYRFEPYFDEAWPLRRDRSVQGGPLSLRGGLYPKGLGVHSQSSVTYALAGQYRWFQATIGIDDDTRGQGSARFEVLLDGKSVFKSDDLTGQSPALELKRIDVSGVKTLTLRVKFGAKADIQDHADWCDAVLVK
ncbi:MAG: hypothetical protein EXS05_19320 [Planctomycetaceae bacterium]|nr:hypothetical protein [Planctomycetaceae bacterium]